jgi:KDO2-lipid IV(A) lauroyltransferase
MQLALGASLGFALYLLRYRVKIVKQNLDFAFSGKPPSALFRQSYAHVGNLILEVFMVLGPLKNFVLNRVDVVGYENYEKAIQLGRGAIFLSSHLGNWEVMAATGGVLKNIDLMLVTKHLKPEWLHQAIEKGRLDCGVTAAYEPKTLRQVLAHLKKGGTVGFVLDQYVGPPVGVRVPLFGIPVGTALVVAAIAKRTKAPVLPVENFRTPDGRWTVQVHPEVPWARQSQSHSQSHSQGQATDAHFELASNTAQYTRVIEEQIFRHPEQWLWMHRRFKGDLSPLREGEWFDPRVRR